MVYGRNLRPGMVISRENGWGLVDRLKPFGSGDATADVWMVGDDTAIKIRVATAARMSPALRSVAALARRLWAERDQLRQRVADAERLSEDIGRERNLRNEQLTDLRTAVLGRLPMPGERHSIAVDAAISHRGDIAYEESRADVAGKRAAALAAAADTADSTTPVVTDDMVQAAIDAALDLAFESFPGPEGRETHRAHDENGGYHGLCPFCRLAGAPESVASPARQRVFRAALEAALAAGPWRTGTPPEATP